MLAHTFGLLRRRKRWLPWRRQRRTDARLKNVLILRETAKAALAHIRKADTSCTPTLKRRREERISLPSGAKKLLLRGRLGAISVRNRSRTAIPSTGPISAVIAVRAKRRLTRPETLPDDAAGTLALPLSRQQLVDVEAQECCAERHHEYDDRDENDGH
jgi:hypothetical protein